MHNVLGLIAFLLYSQMHFLIGPNPINASRANINSLRYAVSIRGRSLLASRLAYVGNSLLNILNPNSLYTNTHKQNYWFQSGSVCYYRNPCTDITSQFILSKFGRNF